MPGSPPEPFARWRDHAENEPARPAARSACPEVSKQGDRPSAQHWRCFPGSRLASRAGTRPAHKPPEGSSLACRSWEPVRRGARSQSLSTVLPRMLTRQHGCRFGARKVTRQAAKTVPPVRAADLRFAPANRAGETEAHGRCNSPLGGSARMGFASRLASQAGQENSPDSRSWRKRVHFPQKEHSSRNRRLEGGRCGMDRNYPRQPERSNTVRVNKPDFPDVPHLPGGQSRRSSLWMPRVLKTGFPCVAARYGK